MVPLFWTNYSFLKPSNASSTSPSKSHDSEAIGRVSDIVNIGKEVQCAVSAAVRACDVKLFPVACVSVSLSSACLIITVVTYVGECDVNGGSLRFS
jgi:hypothetical protein